MIHQALIAAQVGLRYYKIKHPERNYDIVASRRQFSQDNRIDKKVLRQVIKQIFDEQMEMLK